MLRRRPSVRSVGIVGWSLGADLALAAAIPNNSTAFAAVAGFSADPRIQQAQRLLLPPTILLYGGRTDSTFLARAFHFGNGRSPAHSPTEIYVYPDGTHDWPGIQGTIGIAKAAAFLRLHLQQKHPSN